MTRKSDNQPSLGETAGAIGRATTALRQIRLREPRQRGLVAAMEELRASGIDRAPGTGCRGLRVIEESGSGKSEAAKQMVSFVERQTGREPGGHPVLHVTLGTLGTPRDAVASCLKAYRGCHYSTKGTEGDLLDRLEVALEEQGTELMIVDELNHCAGKSLGPDVADTFKNMLTGGWVPIAFLGTSKAKILFDGNRELRTRCRRYSKLSPLHPDLHIEEWTQFTFGMECEMRRLELVDAAIGLDDPDLARRLCIACGGIMGEFVNVIEDSLSMAMEAGSKIIEYAHLRQSVETRFVLDGGLELNPLAEPGDQSPRFEHDTPEDEHDDGAADHRPDER